MISSIIENQKAKRRLSIYPSSLAESKNVSFDELLEKLDGAFVENSLYVHIPFCERMCSFCACNTSITGDHSWEEKYLKYLSFEKESLLEQLGVSRLNVSRLVVGGGTPNFFSIKNFKKLFHILEIERDHRFDDTLIELDWRCLDQEYIDFLKDYGLSQFRLAILDTNPKVLGGIQRNSTIEIQEFLKGLDSDTFDRLNFEFLLGLPFQTEDSFTANLKLIEEYRPQAVTLNHFVKVPWIKENQRLYKESDIPAPEFVADLETQWIQELSRLGYVALGFGYWTRHQEQISQGFQSLDISGPSFSKTPGILGLGVGSLSQFPRGFWTNHKNIPVYSRELERKNPVQDSVVLFSEDQEKKHGEFLNLLGTIEKDQIDWKSLGIPDPLITDSTWRHFLALAMTDRLESP